jgi:hypothetical protein
MWYAQLSLWLQRDIAEAIRKTNAEAFEGLPPKQHTVPHAAIKRLVEIRMIPQYVGGSGAGGPMGDDDGTTAGRLEASSLTGAVSNKDYDVLHYTMTVVLPFRYLGRFQWHLSKENYHTILDVQEVAAPEDRPNTYFYGSEPVVRVVMRGEWKLITEWERPLMPREVLNTLPRGALRDEDVDRPHTPGGQSNLTGDTTGAGRRRGLRGRR